MYVQGLLSQRAAQLPQDGPQLPYNAGEGAARMGPGEEVRVCRGGNACLQAGLQFVKPRQRTHDMWLNSVVVRGIRAVCLQWM